MTTTTITLDDIITISNVTGDSIADIIARIDAAQNAPKRTRKPAQPKAAPTIAWREREASQSQIGRIARAEEAILASGRKRGIKLITRNMGEFANAGAASDYYKTLATFTRKHSIDF